MGDSGAAPRMKRSVSNVIMGDGSPVESIGRGGGGVAPPANVENPATANAMTGLPGTKEVSTLNDSQGAQAASVQ